MSNISSKKILLGLFLLLCSACTNHSPQIQKHESSEELLRLVEEGAVALNESDLDLAESKFLMAESFGKDPRVYEALGSVAFRRRQLQRAEHFFKLTIETDPNHHHVWGNFALLAIARGELKQAQQYFEKAIKYAPEDYKARANYALFLKQLGLPGAKEIAAQAHAFHADDKTKKVLSLVDHKD